MKVLYIITKFANKGPVKQLFYFVKEASFLSIDLSILTLLPEKKDSLRSLFIKYDLHQLSISKPFLLGQYNVVHTSGLLPDLFAFIFASRNQWFSTVRNSPYEDYPGKFGYILGIIMARIHLFILKRCKNIIACSHYINISLSASKINSYTIENSVPWNNKVNLCPRRPETFTYVGSLIERKNISALSNLFNSQPFRSQQLDVFGLGRQEKTLQSSLNIKLHGFVDNLSSIYTEPSIFISLSKSEGMPNACLEAITHQCILVLSTIPPHLRLKEIFPEIIVNAELDYIYDEQYAAYLREEINKLLGEYKTLNWLGIKKKYLELYGPQNMSCTQLEYYHSRVSNEP